MGYNYSYTSNYAVGMCKQERIRGRSSLSKHKFRRRARSETSLLVGSAMKKSLVTDSAEWCFSVYSASTRI